MADVYTRPLIQREGGEVILKEKPLECFYALRYAIEQMRPSLNDDRASFQSVMTLAGLSGVTVANAMGGWDARVYDELMVCAMDCAKKGLNFAGFVVHLVGDFGFTILHEDDEPEEDEDDE